MMMMMMRSVYPGSTPLLTILWRRRRWNAFLDPVSGPGPHLMLYEFYFACSLGLGLRLDLTRLLLFSSYNHNDWFSILRKKSWGSLVVSLVLSCIPSQSCLVVVVEFVTPDSPSSFFMTSCVVGGEEKRREDTSVVVVVVEARYW